MRYPRVEVYRDRAGRWRWRLRAVNGKVIADSGQGYHARRECVLAAKRTRESMADAAVWEVTP